MRRLIYLPFFIALAGCGNSNPVDPATACVGKREAAEAADDAAKKLAGDPLDYERTDVIFSDAYLGQGVGLIYSANGQSGQAVSFTIADDCEVIGIN